MALIILAASPAHAVLVPLTDVVQVEGGGSHGLALLRDGTVLAWGDNFVGQLGTGDTNTYLTPVVVLGPGSGVIAVSAGEFHSLALKADGTLLSWGANGLGQLGNGTMNDQSTPGPVDGMGPGSQVVAIAAGYTHNLALKSDGTVWCWGRNGLGACGVGNQQVTFPSPVQVSGDATGVVAISAGANSSLALKSDGTVLAWGQNGAGQVGDGSTTLRVLPTQVTGLGSGSGVIAIANGSVSGANANYALKSDGTVLAWGANSRGQLGDGTLVNHSTPAEVVGLGAGSGVVALALGSSHALALRSDGTVLAWGSNDRGQLGDGTEMDHSTPVAVANLGPASGVTALAGGAFHSYALKSDGTVLSWGSNSSGQLADGTFFGVTTPAPIPSLGAGSNVTALAAGDGFSLALRSDGAVLAWGANSSGQLGDGTNIARRTPGPIPALGAGSGVVAITAGPNFAFAIKDDGTVLAWGANSSGQLGNNSTIASTVPVQVSGFGAGSGVIAVVARASSAWALRSDGTVWSWGENGAGQLGDGTMTSRWTPVQVHGVGDIGFLSEVTAIAPGNQHAYALRSDGAVLSWGRNHVSQLGNDTVTTSTTPIEVVGLGAGSGVTAIGSVTYGGYALKADGSLFAWGSNGAGFVGDGTETIRPTPVPVSGLGAGSGVVTVVGGGLHVLALGPSGAIWAWGRNSAGQLGDGSITHRSVPAFVPGLSGVVSLAAGAQHSLALRADGEVLAWGANETSQLGMDVSYPSSLTPAPVLVERVIEDMPDGGVSDAGIGDAGVNDAAVSNVDAGVNDASVSNADAGVSDAGVVADAAGPDGDGAGCGCRAASPQVPARSACWLLAAICLWFTLRRPRRAR